MRVPAGDDSLLVDISDALSERDRVRFTVHTRTKLPQFAKPDMSVVRQHEEFIWLRDCLEDNDQYAGYIIPPAPPQPDFDASREKLQRLGDGESSMTRGEFAAMKQELEAEYLAIFKKTVAMHEIFLQRLAAHEKFREDTNFRIFLEYENELAVRGKSKKEKIAGSLHSISKSLSDFVITTSQVAATTSAGATINKHLALARPALATNGTATDSAHTQTPGDQQQAAAANSNGGGSTLADDVDEQYFEKERLFLALYHNSIRETAIQADRASQARKNVADSYLHIAQQLIKLASIEVVPITTDTRDTSKFVACPLPSLTLPQSPAPVEPIAASSSRHLELTNDEREPSGQLSEDLAGPSTSSGAGAQAQPPEPSDKLAAPGPSASSTQSSRAVARGFGCASKQTSEGLKQLLLNVSDFLEQARKVESRIASDEDLKLTDTFLYYKRDTVAAQDLLMRRLRFMAEYENATRNLERARQRGGTQMQYADVIQKQARENFISISKLAKQELVDYKERRVASFRKSFGEIVELELKHLRSLTQMITNCLEICRGITPQS